MWSVFRRIPVGTMASAVGAASVLVTCASPEGITPPPYAEDDAAVPSGASGAVPKDAAPARDAPRPSPAPTATTPPPTLPDDPLPPPDDAQDAGPCTGLVDDLEDKDGSILAVCRRRGFWYTFNDGTPGGAMTPAAGATFLPDVIPGGRGASKVAAHVSGSGFTSWGAALAFDLDSLGGGASKGAYDASAYGSMAFWARSGSEAGTLPVRVSFANADTDPAGGRCSTCNDHFGATVVLGPSWTRYTLSFGALSQQGWGTKVPTFDDRRVYSVQLQVGPNAAFDVWIDDVTFEP